MKTHADEVIELARERGVIRARDLGSGGIPRVILTRLVEAGRLERVGRGLYTLPQLDVSEHHGIVEACRRVPHSVVCLLSALRFHGLTTVEPFEVWLAIDRKARKPKAGHPPLRIVRFTGEALTQGVEEHRIESSTVRVTSQARTVADCFGYRNEIGLDVAVEALREYRRRRRGTFDELWQAAEVARVKSVVRPYLEALT